MVTRRCTQRQFLLLPSHEVNRIVRYCVALAAQRTGVVIHVVCVLANHYHLVVTDVFAQLPEFVYILNKYLAKCVNALRGRWENVFAAGTQASYVELGDDDAIIDKAVYSITNPVAAGLVSRSDLWPGVCLWRPGTQTVKRPEQYFRGTADSIPEKIALTICALPVAAGSTRELMERLGQAVKAEEKRLRTKLCESGRRFLGKARVLAQNWFDSPDSFEPRRGLSPRVASRDKWRRIELLQRLSSFCREHRDALVRFLAGEREVEFPAGTYLMRIRFGVRCAEL